MNAHTKQPGDKTWRSTAVKRLQLSAISLLAILSPLELIHALDLPRGFVAETLATNLNAMTAMALPSDGRIFLADQTGKLLVWKNGRILSEPALTLQVTDYWERGLIGLTLHPDFPRTPHLFVLYVTDKPFIHHVLSRFTMHEDRVIPESEVILLKGDDQSKLGGSVPAGHQGGPIRFGSDGKLYVGIGEQTAGEPSQRLDTFQGKILRVNPDGTVPEDNPFVERTTGKYRAIWAYGLRNPFGLAVQPGTGRMFFTDVGGSAFEEVNELVRGANYGWPKVEGYSNQPEFRPPVYAYPPVIGRSICGGVFYPHNPEVNHRQSPAPLAANEPWPEKWRGKFFFLDYINPWLKALDTVAPTNLISFGSGFNGPIAVEVGPDGSMFVLNRGTIWRDGKRFLANSGSLVRIRYTGSTSETQPDRSTIGGTGYAFGLPADPIALPKRWSDLSIDLRTQNPIAGERVIAYEINVPEWQPGIEVRRLIAIPYDATIRFSKEGDWQFPRGTVFVRRYFDATAGPELRRPIEYRLIVIGDPRNYGASYRVNWDGDDAVLVEDGDMTPLAGNNTHWWFFPPLDDALSLPASNLAYVLDVNTAQLNRKGPNGTNQLVHWNESGIFDRPIAFNELDNLPRMADLDDESASLEARARSYLDVNCAVCHRPGGASRGDFDARFTTPLHQTGLILGPLAAGDLGIDGAKIVVPGRPDQSILYQRLKRNDLFRMPPVQFHNKPSPALPLMEQWIRSIQ